jgi:glutathione S-transferase
MTLPTPLVMMGAPGSPYTRKMRSVLRCRRIPYRFVLQHSPEAAGLPAPKVPLLPTFYLPNEAGETVAVTDSTPLIRRLEKAFEGRSVVPPDPALAFLDELLEDWADEWLTKCMFHYRWYHETDATKARRVLPHWSRTDVSDEEIAPIQKIIGDRQIGRLGVVGSNDVTAEVIEESYRRFLDAFDAQLQCSRFLFGKRPASSDFAMMGQLTCLALFDPRSAACCARSVAPTLRSCSPTRMRSSVGPSASRPRSTVASGSRNRFRISASASAGFARAMRSWRRPTGK